MKRSEAIKFITDILFYGKLAESVRLGARKDFITNLAEEDAESILKELEKFGMRPPNRKALSWSEIGISDDDQIEKPNFTVYKWEPEDE